MTDMIVAIMMDTKTGLDSRKGSNQTIAPLFFIYPEIANGIPVSREAIATSIVSSKNGSRTS